MNEDNNFSEQYFQEIKRILDSLDFKNIQEAIEIIFDAYKNNKQIFILGNGGSATTASHFACDLGKGSHDYGYLTNEKRFRAIALTDNAATMLAYGNDSSFDDIFVEQLKNLVNKGDVVIGISGSGNSKNVIKAINCARESGAKTVGLLGFTTGGKLGSLVDCGMTIQDKHYGRIEDVHLMLTHLMAESLFRLKDLSRRR